MHLFRIAALTLMVASALMAGLPARAAEMLAAADAAFAEDAFLEAERLYRIALAEAEKRDGPDSAAVGIILTKLADAIGRGDDTPWWKPWSERRHAEALPLAQRAVAILERTLGSDHIVSGKADAVLALSYGGLFRHPEGDPYGRRALRILERTPAGPDKNELAMILQHYADLLHIVDHNVEGLEYEDRISFALTGRSLCTSNVRWCAVGR